MYLNLNLFYLGSVNYQNSYTFIFKFADHNHLQAEFHQDTELQKDYSELKSLLIHNKYQVMMTKNKKK